MSGTVDLTNEQKYHSHLVNCKKCHTAIKGNPSVGSSYKLRDLLCPVGKRLFDQAIKENPKKFRMTRFPFVPRMHQEVTINVKGTWKTGRVIDKSISGSGRAIGYEVEVIAPRKYGLPPVLEHYYVNASNIHKIETGKVSKPKAIEIVTQKYTIRLGKKIE